jgi:hypothetical protein
MKINIPSKLTLKHLNLVTEVLREKEPTTENMINFVADFCNVHRDEVARGQHSSLLELYYTLLDLFNEIEVYKEVQPSIKIKGTTYTFRDISNEHPASWWMVSQKELAKGIKSHQIMALCYIEEGMQFNDFDPKHKRIVLNPYKDRCKVFEDAEVIREYMPLESFFLRKLNEYKKPFLSLQRMRRESPQQLKTLLRAI